MKTFNRLYTAYIAYSAPRYNPEFVDGRVAVVDVDKATGNVLVEGNIR